MDHAETSWHSILVNRCLWRQITIITLS